jgi:hypothetical protein
MAQLKSKQIQEFNDNVVWTSADSKEIPNSKDIQNNFVPEAAMVIEEFTSQSISSASANWTLTLSNSVMSNDVSFVSLWINGYKALASINVSVSGTTATFGALGYDIDAIDTLEVHYIKNHSV